MDVLTNIEFGVCLSSKFRIVQLINLLTPIESNLTHENSPRNSPNFAVSPALFGWPAHSRHTMACMHRLFLHTQMTTQASSLVYVRVGSGRYQAGEDMSGHTIISGGFEMATDIRGLSN